MFGKGQVSYDTHTKEELLTIMKEEDILLHYFNINSIPCVVNSPLRQDDNPSFSIFYYQDKLCWKDHATGESGDIFTLFMKLWGCSFSQTIQRLYNELLCNIDKISIHKKHNNSLVFRQSSILDVKIRDWNSDDELYWKQYGISIKTLKWASVYPISHILITKERTTTIVADRLAYVYIERKEGVITKKVYQPYNTRGLKWISKHDHSVVSLWTKMINLSRYNDTICICSSVKDALCLFENTHIPSIALQGEGYGISNTAKNVLLQNFKHIYVLFDNDEPGLKYGEKFANETGFKNIILPYFDDGKDISDLYKCVNNQTIFNDIILELFNNDSTI